MIVSAPFEYCPIRSTLLLPKQKIMREAGLNLAEINQPRGALTTSVAVLTQRLEAAGPDRRAENASR